MDLIDRQTAIDAIEKLILPQPKGETAAEEINRVAWRCAINCAEEMIGCLPSAEKTGKWILNDNSTYSCSLCQSWIPNEQHHYARYCLYCGARMVDEVEE